jgi:hypothetical protein
MDGWMDRQVSKPDSKESNPTFFEYTLQYKYRAKISLLPGVPSL